MTRRSDLIDLGQEIVGCRACPRLVAWREQVAVDKRASYRDETYWGLPIVGFGDPNATIVVLGLAPAAHGANRTGRVFTGDRSGDWLFRALHRAGLANQPFSVSADDGLELSGVWVTAAVKCAPPGNQPLPSERDACAAFLKRELGLLSKIRVVVCLGGFGYDAACRHYGVKQRPKFGHGVEFHDVGYPNGEYRGVEYPGVETIGGLRPVLLCSYHPSQQNTFTGRLTEPMLDAVFARAVEISRWDG